MIKILYAAGNNVGSKIQLDRFLTAVKNKPFIIKVAAYKKSNPYNVNIDWTLDCLLNMFKPEHISLDNENFSTYFEQVKYYNPDLIISDLEYFTSYVANYLNITLWQCSSLLINHAIHNDYKYNLGLFKNYSFILNRKPIQTQRIVNIIDNSNYNLVYSHFGDTTHPPILKDNYKWVRPYHGIGKIYKPCCHNVIASMTNNNKHILNILKKYPDSVSFSEVPEEFYKNVTMKNHSNQEEYACNVKNSALFLCEGQTSFLADAFYNGKYSVILNNLKDAESITNSIFSEHLNLSTIIYSEEDLNKFIDKFITVNYDETIPFLHQRLEEL